ncbi:integrase core domain-containing protein, partial [Escherichia coli]|nr:integrase core domain-containing protein [Escherichia coli]
YSPINKRQYGAPLTLTFFHSLKVECIHGERFSSREIMRATVFNYIECDYNRWRRHSACGGLSPDQFENHNLA